MAGVASVTSRAGGPGGAGDLRQRLIERMRRGLDQTLDDSAFDELARAVFAWQFERNRIYRAFCERRGVSPDNVADWLEIPAVPTVAFKEVRLVANSGGEPDATFRTSGTTRGAERRGEHVVPDLTLYDASLLPTFRGCVLPDDASLPFLCFVPPYHEQPDSSLSYMVSVAARRLGATDGAWYVSSTAGLDVDGSIGALRAACRQSRPVALVGTTLSFVHLLEALAQREHELELPPGSRVVDTGGFKGENREVRREDMAASYERWLGIPVTHQVNEYGMTEMCSQFYDARLRDATSGRTPREVKIGPPWVRTIATDPDTLEPLPPGRTGILRHHDLANLGSVAAIQTEDLGLVNEDGSIELLGRLGGAPPRGCSIALDMLLRER